MARYLALTTSPALPLLYCLFHGLLGHRLSIRNVPCLFGYVLEPTRNQVRYQANLTATATGIMFIYQATRLDSPTVTLDTIFRFEASYFSTAFTLNILLTLMIVARLALHRKKIRNVMGTTAGVGGSYKAAIAIIVESSALLAVSFLMYVGPWAAKSSFQYIPLQIFAQTQVRVFLTYRGLGTR